MSVSIVPCPSCDALLLGDTIQCPDCHHVVDPQRAGKVPEAAVLQQQTQSPKGLNEIECPDCGEMVRSGLVRCWQCGAFLREEIAESFQRMQQSQKAVDVAPLPNQETTQAKTLDAEVDSGGGESTSTGDDGTGGDSPQQMSETAQSGTYGLVATESSAATNAEPGTTDVVVSQQEMPKETEGADEMDSTRKTTSGDNPKSDTASENDDRESTEPHSVVTGGDALLDIALEEENETKERHNNQVRSSTVSSDNVLLIPGSTLFCHTANLSKAEPVLLEARPLGLMGRCRSCDVALFVPNEQWYEQKREKRRKAQEPTDGAASDTEPVGKYNCWVNDVRIHNVDPQKLNLKSGSLEGAYDSYDFGFSEEELLTVSLSPKKGGLLFGGKSDKIVAEVRKAVLEYLADNDKTIEELPASNYRILDTEAVKQIAVVQPAPYIHESMFAGIPVFGVGRIAIRMPHTEKSTNLTFASFSITQFREFAKILDERFGIKDLGESLGVPLRDVVTENTCHYSEEKFVNLKDIEYYQADPALRIKLVGRRCQECGLVVSEDSRKKEKIGGSNGRSIAKAKCPKCGKKFGDISLYGHDEAIAATPAAAGLSEPTDS